MTGLAIRRHVVILAVFAVAAAAAVWQPGAVAATGAIEFTVTTTTDPASPGHCDSTTHECTTLRAAIAQANALTGTDVVNVRLPAGTYSLLQGQLSIRGLATLTVEGASAGTTVVERAPSSGPSRVFDIAYPTAICHYPWPVGCDVGPRVSLAKLTVRNGNDGAGSISIFGGTVRLTNIAVTSNTGPGISANFASLSPENYIGGVTIDRSSVVDNAGVGITSGAYLSISNSTISRNIGGGITSSFAGVEITNSTLSDNVGGAYSTECQISVAHGRGCSAIRFTNSTITGNGAGLYVRGPDPYPTPTLGRVFVLKNTIIADNTNVANGSRFDGNCNDKLVTSLGYNLDSGHTCGLAGPGDLIDTNPRLGRLQDNGGPTMTHALLPDSPAIDAVGAGCPPPDTDQRGIRRQDGACDIGAFEFTDPPAITSVSPGSGPSGGGTHVVISGSGLTRATEVRFGSAPAKFSVTSGVSIIAMSPAHDVGSVHITVTGPRGTSAAINADEFTFVAPAVPAISATPRHPATPIQLAQTGAGSGPAARVSIALLWFLLGAMAGLVVSAIRSESEISERDRWRRGP